jgi:hypothetical protein
MTSINACNHGACRSADGRSGPYGSTLGNPLASLALMLQGRRLPDQGYAGGWSGPTNTLQSGRADNPTPAFANSWAALADHFGQSSPANRLPMTRAQELFMTPADPYIETLP